MRQLVYFQQNKRLENKEDSLHHTTAILISACIILSFLSKDKVTDSISHEVTKQWINYTLQTTVTRTKNS